MYHIDTDFIDKETEILTIKNRHTNHCLNQNPLGKLCGHDNIEVMSIT